MFSKDSMGQNHREGSGKAVSTLTLKNWREDREKRGLPTPTAEEGDTDDEGPATEAALKKTEPVRTEPLRDYGNKVLWERALTELQEATRTKREHAKALARAIKGLESELGDPHVLETMRGLLDQI